MGEGLFQGARGSSEVSARRTEGILVFLVALTLYALLSMGPPTHFNAHVHLADAWLSGLVTPETLPPHIEHVQGPTGAILPYGPGPAILLLPFVALWGLDTNQSAFCMLVGALNVALMGSVLAQLGLNRRLRLGLTALFAVGSPHLFYAVQSGNTWPLMHIVTIFGMLIALRGVFSPPTAVSGLMVGLGLGLAYLTRQPSVLAVPFVMAMSLLGGRGAGAPDVGRPGCDETVIGWLKRLPWWHAGAMGLGFGACVALTLLYNWARMGTPLDTGYERVIMAITPEHVIPYGVFSWEYVGRNLHAYVWSGPERIAEFPFFRPSQFQMSMFLVFPALFLIPLADWRERVNGLALGAIASMMTVYLLYYWTGATQFGMRYALDWLPLGMLLIASAVKGRSPLLWIAVGLGMAIEAWGLVMWRLLGWV